MSAPLFYVGFTLLFTAMLLSLMPEVFAFYLGLFAFGLFLIFCLKKERTVVLVLASIFAACFLFFVKTEFDYKPVQENAGKTIDIKGQVVGFDKKSDSGMERYTIKASDGPLAGKTLRLTTKDNSAHLNDLVEFKGKISALSGNYFKARNMYVGSYAYGKITVIKYEDVYASMPIYKRFSSFVRAKTTDASSYLETRLLIDLPSDYAYVLYGMLIGEKDSLPQIIYENFQRAGIVHLLAVSGFHTSLWSMLFYRALLRRGVNMRLSAALTVGFVLAFLALTGFSKSTIRASIALIVFFLGRILSRQSDSKSSLGLAAIIIIVLNPFAGGDTGFLLSFFSTLGILTVFPIMLGRVREFLRSHINNREVCDKVLDAFSVVLVTLSTLLFTLPVTMVTIGEVSLISPLTNLLVTSGASLAIMLSGLAVVASFIPVISAFEKPLMLVSALIIKYVVNVSAWISTFSFSSVDISSGYAMVTVAAVLILIGFSLMLKANFKRTVLLSFVIVFASVITHYLV